MVIYCSMPVFKNISAKIFLEASVLEVAQSVTLPVHSGARAAFETWLCLPDAARPDTPYLPGLGVVAPDGPTRSPAVVSGFAAYHYAQATTSQLNAIMLPLNSAEITRAAEGEVAPVLAALDHAHRHAHPSTPRIARSLLETILREFGQK